MSVFLLLLPMTSALPASGNVRPLSGPSIARRCLAMGRPRFQRAGGGNGPGGGRVRVGRVRGRVPVPNLFTGLGVLPRRGSRAAPDRGVPFHAVLDGVNDNRPGAGSKCA